MRRRRQRGDGETPAAAPPRRRRRAACQRALLPAVMTISVWLRLREITADLGARTLTQPERNSQLAAYRTLCHPPLTFTLGSPIQSHLSCRSAADKNHFQRGRRLNRRHRLGERQREGGTSRNAFSATQ